MYTNTEEFYLCMEFISKVSWIYGLDLRIFSVYGLETIVLRPGLRPGPAQGLKAAPIPLPQIVLHPLHLPLKISYISIVTLINF
jgi:hypothetical protein